MSYDLIEISNDYGEPIFLYEFTVGKKVWRYTPSTEPVAAAGEMFMPIMISDEGISQTGEAQTDTVKIIIDFNADVVDLFKVTPPIDQIIVRRMVRHEFDSEVAVNYVGFISQANFGTIGQVEFECITLSPTMQRSGLRLYWSRSCPYVLYDQATCKVRKEDYALYAVVEKAANGLINAKEFGTREDGYFMGGYIEWESERTGAAEMRSIDDHSGDQIRLLGRSDGIPVGTKIKAYPGCPKTIDVCRARFGNDSNYGGYPHLPGKSPFDGDPLY